MNLTKTPYLVLFVLLGAAGVGTAAALGTITLAGDVMVTDNLTVDKDVTVVGNLEAAELSSGYAEVNGEFYPQQVWVGAGGNEQPWGFGDVYIEDDLEIDGTLHVDGGFDCNGCIDSGDIGSNQVNALEISAGAVGTSEIADGSIKGEDIDSSTSITINGFDCNGCIDSGDIGSNQVNALEISAGAVGSSEIASGAIGGHLEVSTTFTLITEHDGLISFEILPSSNSICFLTSVNFREIDTFAESVRCSVKIFEGNWYIEAFATPDLGGGIGSDAYAACVARCLIWD